MAGFSQGVQSCLAWLPEGLAKCAGFTPGALWHVLQRKMLELPSEEGQCGEISGGGGLPPLPLQEPFGHGPSWAGAGGLGCVWLQGPGRLIGK